ncbi:hypothetical protein K1T71_006717 [Dendrolimus kikuchii]|uniref:Uncharacterized protein n=1 Tax=Dendrolimus kikuchii TaxID=765133 RepID=A0ACC1D1L2_9NEOP|nr:hypothetical protein K1T71_006717 [Dendrolimus kikuchii]
MKKAGYTKKLNIWVPHELTERNLMNRVLICDSLLRRNETEPFLKKLITGDEKWIMYDKNVRKRSWSKAGQASQTGAKPGCRLSQPVYSMAAVIYIYTILYLYMANNNNSKDRGSWPQDPTVLTIQHTYINSRNCNGRIFHQICGLYKKYYRKSINCGIGYSVRDAVMSTKYRQMAHIISFC